MAPEENAYAASGCCRKHHSALQRLADGHNRRLRENQSQCGLLENQKPYGHYQQYCINEPENRTSNLHNQYDSKDQNQALNHSSHEQTLEEKSPPPYQECNTLRPFSGQGSSNSSQFFSPNRLIPSASSSMLFPANKLSKVIAIPATDPTAGSPFLRAYPPVLQSFNILREKFLEFLDRLNRAAVASPPAQIFGLAGNIVSMVPLHTAQVVGGTINAVSSIGSRTIAKGHTELVLREGNKDIFKSKGLKVQVAKLDAVASIARMPILTPDGKIEKHAAVLQPFESADDYKFVTAQERRLKALARWIEELDVEGLPQLAEGSNILSKMHASVSETQRKKGEEKMMKERAEAQKEFSRGSEKAQREYEEKMAELDRDQSRAEGRRKDKDRHRDLRRVEERREKPKENWGREWLDQRKEE